MYWEIQGDRVLIIDDDKHGHDIPLKLIASCSELLGITDPVDAINAIVHFNRHGGTDPDPLTNENVWTESYFILQLREQLKCDEATRECPADEYRSPKLRALLKAAQVIGQGDNCSISKARKKAREHLGLPEPTGRCSSISREKVYTMDEMGKPERDDLETALRDRAADLNEFKREYLLNMTTYENDPLLEPEEVAEEPEDLDVTPEGILARYGL